MSRIEDDRRKKRLRCVLGGANSGAGQVFEKKIFGYEVCSARPRNKKSETSCLRSVAIYPTHISVINRRNAIKDARAAGRTPLQWTEGYAGGRQHNVTGSIDPLASWT